jgi:hypothetical protein
MISEGRDDQKMLRVFMGALLDKSLLAGKPQAMAVSFHASMFGHMAKCFQTKFMDPLDKPARRSKTYERIQQFFIQHIFTQNVGNDKEIIDNGCAISMNEVLEYVFPELLSDFSHEQTFISLFIQPMLNLLKGNSSQ